MMVQALDVPESDLSESGAQNDAPLPEPSGESDLVERLRTALFDAGFEPYEFSLSRESPVKHRMQHRHVEEFGSCTLKINSAASVDLLIRKLGNG